MQLGHDVDTVSAEGLVGSTDGAVWDAAQSARRFLITQDLDFSDVRKLIPGRHHGVLILRLREPGREAVLNRIRTVFATENVSTWPGAFVVATDRRVRVRRKA